MGAHAECQTPARESAVKRTGERILSGRGSYSILRAGIDPHLSQFLADEALRVQVLRLLDVLPALQEDGQVLEHFQAYFGALTPEQRPALLQ